MMRTAVHARRPNQHRAGGGGGGLVRLGFGVACVRKSRWCCYYAPTGVSGVKYCHYLGALI